MIAFALYLIKVTICSGILLLYYHLALRNKSFHQWNRFYLLFSILIALAAPILQVGIVHYTSEEGNNAIQILRVLQTEGGNDENLIVHAQSGISQEQWLFIIYVAISVILFAGFLMSLRKINSIIKAHTFQWIEKIKFISTRAEGTPFSFFNFIFWNEEIDLQTETGKQIFQHELVHVKERHSLDKIMIQLILVVFWCNPFFWLIRRELKLIHEFIADERSVGQHGTAALASMILKCSYPTQFNTITNHFFQTSIKRRLMMLTKIHNPRINYVSRLLALPILAATVLAFTLRAEKVVVSNAKLDKQITVVIDAGHGRMPDGNPNGVAIDNLNEDDIVLAIAKKIKELNKNDQLKIVLTRTSRELVELHKRVDIAKINNADLFISLHIDAHLQNDHPDMSSPNSLKSGFAVYVSNKNTIYQQQSEKFASAIQQQLNSIYPTNPYLLKRKVGIWVLDKNICPSVLLECGFLTDAKDRKFISEEDNQTEVAQNVLKAIERYALSQEGSKEVANDTVPQPQKPQIKEVIIKDRNASTKNQVTITDRTNSQNPPLYLVDGKELSKAELDQIDAATIESISVLKGDAATAKYGKKGANGVVEVRLKSSKTIQQVNLRPTPADTVPKTEPLFTKVEKEPFVDKTVWSAFLRKNLQTLMEGGAMNGIKPGTYVVKVNFIVKTDGSIYNIEALNDPGYGLAEKTVAFMKESPKWSPAMQNGKPVNCYHTQPVTFVIQEQ